MARSPNRLKASIVDLTFIIWAIAVPMVFGRRLFNGDGDFARHLRMGEFILAGGPFQTDAFAHTFTGPFLTTEWLSQVSFALAHRVGGLSGDAVLAGILIASAYALIVLYMRRQGVDSLLAYTTGVVAAILGAPHWVSRPHIFTFVGLAALLHLAATARRPKLWVFVPFFIVWVNFHGGFVLGLMILAALLGGDLVEAWISGDDTAGRESWLGHARFHASALAIGIGTSVINPMGFRLPLRVLNILGDEYLLQNSTEFQSPDFHLLYGKALIIVIAFIITAFALRKERPSFPWLSVILMMLAGALYAKRNIPLFGLVALPLFAVDIDAAWRVLAKRRLTRMRDVFEEGENLAVRGRWAPWFVLALVLLAMNGGRIAGTQLVTNEFSDRAFPVEAVKAARAAGLRGTMFNYFTWGGYILWAWPEQRIYIDGMTDFLGSEVLESYSRVFAMNPGWEDELTRHDVNIVILPTDFRVTYAMRQKPEWTIWYEDETATILTLGEPVFEVQ